jgi:hypothetical protein
MRRQTLRAGMSGLGAHCDRSDLVRAELKAMIDLPGRRDFAGNRRRIWAAPF